MQTVPRENWELLLIDNASDSLLAESWDLGWHPAARHVREDVLGLTSARLRAIAEARGEVLVFVDDDNLLNKDYLEHCARIARDWPILGAWGGQQFPEFEIEAPEYAKPLLAGLACRTLERASWSNTPFAYETMPIGAGMCVRIAVAKHYAELATRNSSASRLGRVGGQLTACDDHDLAMTACDLGLGMGVFPELKLTHLIPKERLEKPYLLRLAEGDAYSTAILRHLRGLASTEAQGPKAVLKRILRDVRRRWHTMTGQGFGLEIYEARERGRSKALKEIARERRS